MTLAWTRPKSNNEAEQWIPATYKSNGRTLAASTACTTNTRPATASAAQMLKAQVQADPIG